MTVSSSARRVAALNVKHPTKLLDLLIREVPPRQYVRELVQNELDAGATRVELDAWSPRPGVQLLRVAGDGKGMPPRQLEQRLRDLADPDVLENFGIGARLATAAGNPAGVTWASRAAGAPAAMVKMIRHRSGELGLEQFVLDGDELAIVVEPDAGMLPAFTHPHGTAVILHGTRDGQNTWRDRDAYTLAHYLANRYWTFGDATVRVRGWRHGGTRTSPARVPSFSELVGKRADCGGVVELGDGSRVRWHRLAEPGSQEGHRNLLTGGIVVRHGNEIYDRADRERASNFGLLGKAVQARALLVIEPADELGVQPNAQRSRLVRPGSRPLPWREWALDFAEQMPEPLRELLPTMSTVADLSKLADRFGDEWRKRVRALGRTVSVQRGELAGAEGPDTMPAELEAHRDGDEHEQHEQRAHGVPLERLAPNPPRRRAVDVEADGRTRARRGRRHELPTFRWVPEAEWLHDEGTAFAYIEGPNAIELLEPASMVRSTVDYWRSTAGATDVDIESIVRHAFEVEMAGKVLHALDGLLHRPGWIGQPVDVALSPRVLTVAALGFHALDSMIGEAVQATRRDEADQ